MVRTNKFLAIAFTAIALAVVGGLFYAYQTKAAQSRLFYPLSCTTQGTSATSISTSSITYLGPGTATSTLTCNQSLSGQGNEVFDTAAVAVQFTGSSTASTLQWNYEYSQDGVDWYADSMTNFLGTSSPKYNVSVPNYYLWNFASSTQGGVIGSSNRILRTVNVPVPTRYFRVIFTMPAASLNGAVWAGVVGKSQTI